MLPTETIKAFVIKENKATKFHENNVLCLCYELGEFRIFNKTPFFDGMKLFRGKNIWFDITINPPQMTTVCKESKQSKLRQLWNYYIKGKF